MVIIGACHCQHFIHHALNDVFGRIYDSDIRKYVYTFNGIGISSFDENDIYNKEIDGILTATYTAQKAISKILDKYKDICTVYYLYNL